MDARCYSGSKVRTKYKKLTLSFRDLVGALAIAVALAGVIMLNIFDSEIMLYLTNLWG